MNSTTGSWGRGLLFDILDHLNDGVYALDCEGRIIYWNKAAETITGYASSRVLGKSCAESLNHCDAEGGCLCNTACPMKEAMATGTFSEHIIHIRHRDGTRIPVAVRVWPTRDDQGQIKGAVQVFSEEVARTLATKRLEQLGRAVDEDALTGVRNRR